MKWTMTPVEIRQLLNTALKATGWSVAEWAKRARVHKSTIFRALDERYDYVTSNRTLGKLLSVLPAQHRPTRPEHAPVAPPENPTVAEALEHEFFALPDDGDPEAFMQRLLGAADPDFVQMLLGAITRTMTWWVMDRLELSEMEREHLFGENGRFKDYIALVVLARTLGMVSWRVADELKVLFDLWDLSLRDETFTLASPSAVKIWRRIAPLEDVPASDQQLLKLQLILIWSGILMSLETSPAKTAAVFRREGDRLARMKPD